MPLPQPLERARGARLHGSRPYAENGGGLRLRQIEEVPADEHEPRRLRELPQVDEQAPPLVGGEGLDDILHSCASPTRYHMCHDVEDRVPVEPLEDFPSLDGRKEQEARAVILHGGI